MAFVIKTAKVLRNHWKKSVLGTCVLLYGVKYARNKHAEELIRRAFCEDAQKYGNAVLHADEKPRKVTVFLNPAVHGGNGTKLFNKNAAPMLYLAGMEVNVVKTEYEGQVKEFIKVLEAQDTDAVIIAGGDGTLLEGVTGFMRKEDKKFRNNIPVGVIPLGKTNRFAQLLFGTDLKQVSLIAESAMAVIKGETKQVDVMKIEGKEGKATYALSGLETGLFRDAEQRKTKNWYFGPLKHYWTYIRTTLRNDWPLTLNGKLKYVEATEENTKLIALKSEEPPKPKSTFAWLLSFLYNQSPRPPVASDLVMNDSADIEQERDMSAVEFTIMTNNYNTQNSIPALDVGIGPSEPTKKEFISEGWRRVKERHHDLTLGTQTNETLRVKSLSLEPDEEKENAYKSPKEDVYSIDLKPLQSQGQWFNIDGESFEAMPVTISLLRNKIRMYYSPKPASVT